MSDEFVDDIPSMSQQSRNFLPVAILESKGIVTHNEAEAFAAIAASTVILSYDAARHLVYETLARLDSWDTCEVCRRTMWGWQQSLQGHHEAGHPILNESESAE